MHFVFVYPSPGIWGGIETQMIRMAHWLVSNDHQVTIVTFDDLAWRPSLPASVRCIALGSKFWRFKYYHRARSLWRSLNIPRPDVIKSFNVELETAWIAYQLAIITGAKTVAGFYGPVPILQKAASGFFLRSFVRNLPERARIFMSPEQIEEFEARHGQGGELWLLPVDSDRFAPAIRRPVRGKIVSIGRLGDMKCYNLYMIDVVAELISRGHDVTWTVHGTGEYEERMREAVRARKLDHVITMTGAMPYEQCRLALANAYVFVGMGTAIIEASLFGVPNVLALAFDSEGLTYGPLYRMPLGSVGDVCKEPPSSTVVQEVERILTLTPADYQAEAEQVLQYVKPYESDVSMQRFVELARQAPHPSRRFWPCVENYLYAPTRRLARLWRDVRAVALAPPC